MSAFYASIRAELLLAQTMIAVLIFGYYLPKRKHFYIRLFTSLVLGGLLSHFGAILLYFPNGSGIAYVFPRTLFMLLGFAISIAVTYAIYDVSGYADENAGTYIQRLLRKLVLRAHIRLRI